MNPNETEEQRKERFRAYYRKYYYTHRAQRMKCTADWRKRTMQDKDVAEYMRRKASLYKKNKYRDDEEYREKCKAYSREYWRKKHPKT